MVVSDFWLGVDQLEQPGKGVKTLTSEAGSSQAGWDVVMCGTSHLRLAIPSNVLFDARVAGRVVARERSRLEHRMDQLHHGLNGEWLLQKRDMINADSIGLAVLFRQARH